MGNFGPVVSTMRAVFDLVSVIMEIRVLEFHNRFADSGFSEARIVIEFVFDFLYYVVWVYGMSFHWSNVLVGSDSKSNWN